MGLSIVIIFVYYIIMALGRALGDGGRIAPIVGAWLPNILIGIVGLILIWVRRK
jgi:lipopolysaccharide export system permease protein